MPRIASALAAVATVLCCVGFNMVRYPIVWDMVAEAEHLSRPSSPEQNSLFPQSVLAEESASQSKPEESAKPSRRAMAASIGGQYAEKPRVESPDRSNAYEQTDSWSNWPPRDAAPRTDFSDESSHFDTTEDWEPSEPSYTSPYEYRPFDALDEPSQPKSAKKDEPEWDGTQVDEETSDGDWNDSAKRNKRKPKLNQDKKGPEVAVDRTDSSFDVLETPRRQSPKQNRSQYQPIEVLPSMQYASAPVDTTWKGISQSNRTPPAKELVAVARAGDAKNGDSGETHSAEPSPQNTRGDLSYGVRRLPLVDQVWHTPGLADQSGLPRNSIPIYPSTGIE